MVDLRPNYGGVIGLRESGEAVAMNTMGRAGAGMGLLGFRIRFRVSCFLQGHSTLGQVHIFWDSGSPNRVYSLTFCPSEKYCKTIRLAEDYEKKS